MNAHVREFEEAATAQVDRMTVSSEAMSGKVNALVDAHLAYARQSFEETGLFMRTLAGQRSFQEAIELQAEYLRGQCTAFIGQAEKMAGLCRDIVEEAVRPAQAALGRAGTFAG